jgi:glutamyl/glutaminyl-tRNA synthetase
MLHLGNICAFGAAWLSVRAQGGELLYRLEDIDETRSREAIAAAQMDDLSWLGLHWDRETRRQSLRDYASPLEALRRSTYWCECTRKEIRANEGRHPGDCYGRQNRQGALRFRLPAERMAFTDRLWGAQEVALTDQDDPVLRRRDGIISYTLAVVADDLRDGVTEVVRGADLLEMTGIQIALWQALQGTTPTWLHAPVILGPDGKKLSKSHGSTEVRALRDQGWSPQDVWALVLPWLGIAGEADLAAAVERFDPSQLRRGPIQLPAELGATTP